MILLLVGCGGPDEGKTPEVEAEPTPAAGVYAVTVAEEWEGDCELEDPLTYEAPEQEWTADPRGDVLILYLDYWSPHSCTLDGMDFSCDDGSWSGGRAQVTRLVEGTFSEDGLAGALVVELDCSGAGCDTLEELYGRRLDFPCRVEAAVEGELR